MSDINMDEYEDYEEPLQEVDFIEVFQPSSGGLRREKQILINEVGVDIGLKLTPDRIAFQELTSGTLSVSGWYTIAETEADNYMTVSADFDCILTSSGVDSSVSFKTKFNASNTARTNKNTTIQITGRSSVFTTFGLLGVRIAKSDTVANSGVKIQLNISAGANPFSIATMATKNIALNSVKGLFLVTPYLDNTPTLPDGVTSATFLEAGAEYSFGTANFQPSTILLKSTDDQMFATVIWDNIPKQGTNISFDSPTSIRIYQGSTFVTLSSPTYSNLSVSGKNVFFKINEVGAFASLAGSTVSHIRTILDDVKLIIT